MNHVFVVRDRNGTMCEAFECVSARVAYREARSSRRWHDRSRGWNAPHTLVVEDWSRVVTRPNVEAVKL